MKPIKFLSMLMVAAIGFAVIMGAGCCTTEVNKKATGNDCAIRPACPAALAGPTINSNNDRAEYTMFYPSGAEATSFLKIEGNPMATMSVGKTYDYNITITNISPGPLSDVLLRHKLKDTLKVQKTSPKATIAAGKVAQDKELTKYSEVAWNLGDFAPAESKTVTVWIKAVKDGAYKHCVNLDYISNVCLKGVATSPKLKLVKTIAPKEIGICETAAMTLTVKNPGSGTVTDVKIIDNLPEGLVTVKGEKRQIAINVGTLKGGESKSYKAILKATKTGTFHNSAVATSSEDLRSESKADLTVRKPVLNIKKTGTKLQFIGRNVDYAIVLRNTGDMEAKNIVMVDTIPAKAQFVSATNGGKFTNGTVQWKIPALGVGKQMKANVTIKAKQAGIFVNRVRAKDDCQSDVEDSAQTEIVGIPAMLLEVVDTPDPIEIGNETTYIIKATNQGTAPDTNIKIQCAIEDGLSLGTIKGSTASTANGNSVTFGTVSSLAPGDTATWYVKVKGHKAGDYRFKVKMVTDNLKRPVEETESTRVY